MIQPTHFIEQVKFSDGSIKNLSIAPINILKWSLNVNSKIGIETIAVFKIQKHAGN
jgi:hypothetical protein